MTLEEFMNFHKGLPFNEESILELAQMAEEIREPDGPGRELAQVANMFTNIHHQFWQLLDELNYEWKK